LGPNGEELLNTTKIRGNQLAGQDSTGLGSKHEGTINIGSAGPGPVVTWEPPARGSELNWQIHDQAEIFESPLGTTFYASGSLNPQIHSDLKINFYKDLPRIDFEWKFEFNKASVGSFFDDETKLRVQWPLAFAGLCQHDIAFGVVPTLEERPFFPVSWADISDNQKGFAYFHQGTIKHWVKDQMLVNLFAWGEDTDAIGNRIGIYRWPKTFDQRLDGRHTIKYSIYPHQGDWRFGNVSTMARSYINPPLPFIKAANSGGSLTAQMELLQIQNPDHIVTAIKVENSDLLCRLYSVSLNEEPVKILAKGLEIKELTAISGEVTKKLAPYKIGKILLKKV
jgi:alpha-mannosidase